MDYLPHDIGPTLVLRNSITDLWPSGQTLLEVG